MKTIKEKLCGNPSLPNTIITLDQYTHPNSAKTYYANLTKFQTIPIIHCVRLSICLHTCEPEFKEELQRNPFLPNTIITLDPYTHPN